MGEAPEPCQSSLVSDLPDTILFDKGQCRNTPQAKNAASSAPQAKAALKAAASKVGNLKRHLRRWSLRDDADHFVSGAKLATRGLLGYPATFEGASSDIRASSSCGATCGDAPIADKFRIIPFAPAPSGNDAGMPHVRGDETPVDVSH